MHIGCLFVRLCEKLTNNEYVNISASSIYWDSVRSAWAVAYGSIDATSKSPSPTPAVIIVSVCVCVCVAVSQIDRMKAPQGTVPGIAAGLAKGHIVTKRTMKVKPSSTKVPPLSAASMSSNPKPSSPPGPQRSSYCSRAQCHPLCGRLCTVWEARHGAHQGRRRQLPEACDAFLQEKGKSSLCAQTTSSLMQRTVSQLGSHKRAKAKMSELSDVLASKN